MPSGPEWIWVIIVVVVIFGASRLPLLGRNLGQGIKEFKKGVKEAASSDDSDSDSKKAESGQRDGASPNTVEPTPDTLADRRD